MIADIAIDITRKGKSFAMRTSGISMIPLIWPGSIITVTPYGTQRSPEVGDVCIFVRKDKILVAHRITALLPNGGVRTQGDSVLTPDADVTADNILGRGAKLSIGPIKIDLSGRLVTLIGKALMRTAPLSRHVNHWMARVALKTHNIISTLKS